MYTMKNFLMDPPTMGIFNNDQTVCMVTSINDILFMDIERGWELDIDEKEHVGDIQNIISDDLYFYVFANKKNGKLGYFLFRIKIKDPEAEYEYLIIWETKNMIK